MATCYKYLPPTKYASMSLTTFSWYLDKRKKKLGSDLAEFHSFVSPYKWKSKSEWLSFHSAASRCIKEDYVHQTVLTFVLARFFNLTNKRPNDKTVPLCTRHLLQRSSGGGVLRLPGLKPRHENSNLHRFKNTHPSACSEHIGWCHESENNLDESGTTGSSDI